MNELLGDFSPEIARRQLIDQLSTASVRLPPTDWLRLLVPRRHTLVSITWPGGGR